MRRVSDGSPSILAVAPVAMTIVWPSNAASAVRTTNGRRVKSTSTTSSPSMSVPNRSACLRIVSISSGPSTGSTKPG